MSKKFLKLYEFQALNTFLNTEKLLARLFWELATDQETHVAQPWVLEFPVFKTKYTNLDRLFR
jgi:hypothetical protein